MPEWGGMLPLTIAGLAFVSATVTAVVGFGAGLLLTPVLALLMPLPQALAIGALIFLVTSGSKILWYLRDIDWGTWRYGLLLSLPGLAAGLALLLWAPPVGLERAYGALLLVVTGSLLLGPRLRLPELHQAWFPLAAGALSALLHGGGPLYYGLCRRRRLNRLRTVGTMAVIHFSLNLLKVGFFTEIGALDRVVAIRLLPAGLLAVAGTWCGRQLLLHRVNERQFTCLVGVVMLAMALNFLL